MLPLFQSRRHSGRPASYLSASALALLLTQASCSSPMPLPTVESVDLPRFMGDWYVMAHLPARIEREAVNAVESYALREDGKIATTYTFRKGGFDGPIKTYRPTGTVRDRETNATWDMQFLWPFQAEYLIVDLDTEYQTTIIGRSKLDYVWVMSRKPSLEPADWERIEARLAELGYDPAQVRRVPHRWPDSGHPIQTEEASDDTGA